MAVVATATSWAEFPGLWRSLLDEVREHAQGRNVMVYLDDVPHVEVGVLVRGEFTPGGREVPEVEIFWLVHPDRRGLLELQARDLVDLTRE